MKVASMLFEASLANDAAVEGALVQTAAPDVAPLNSRIKATHTHGQTASQDEKKQIL